MLIVDAQIHLWSKGTTLPPHRAEPYLMAEALRDMDAAGVDRALRVVRMDRVGIVIRNSRETNSTSS